ncbi:Retrovirus-related Pol polyprotein from transposon RE1 [Euphorbia peplus]|nr:Retrovirus-related Pol polyprotein from transposon RE1 [Euphorbia peplus]
MTEADIVANPMTHGIDLFKDGEEMSDPAMFRRLVGRLLYLQFTRPDLTFATQQLSQFMQKPCEHHFLAAQHVLRYLKGTANYGIFYSSTITMKVLTAYCDADWGRCKKTGRSVT